jgi:ferrous iron transport protein A
MSHIGQLQVGDRARVCGYVDTGRSYRRRLLSMGLTPGTEFSLTRVAPLGDPVEIRVRGFALMLRKDEAAALSVEKL